MNTPPIVPVYITTKHVLDAKCFSLDAFLRYLNEEFRSVGVFFRRTPKVAMGAEIGLKMWTEMQSTSASEAGGLVQDCVVCLELYSLYFPLYENIIFEEDLNAVKELGEVKRLYVFLQENRGVEWNLERFQGEFRAVCAKYFSGAQPLKVSSPEKGQAPYAYLDSLQQQGEIYHANYVHHKNRVQEYEKQNLCIIILEKSLIFYCKHLYFLLFITKRG